MGYRRENQLLLALMRTNGWFDRLTGRLNDARMARPFRSWAVAHLSVVIIYTSPIVGAPWEIILSRPFAAKRKNKGALCARDGVCSITPAAEIAGHAGVEPA
jgi:hypothetical protein